MMKGNLIIGAGGHGKVIADLMQCQGIAVIGFLDDDLSLIGQQVLGLPVLGKTDQWIDFEPTGLVVGVGDNTIRRKIVDRLLQHDAALPWVTLVHPNAVVAASVRLGVGTVVMAGAIINADTVVGDHAIVNTGATIDHDCEIGSFVHIAPGTNLAGGVTVGEGTLIGISACVIPLKKIGRETVVGAGAVVIDDIPDNVVAKGNPARR